MCRNVIIHCPNGQERVCKSQFELMNEMQFGIINYDNDPVMDCCLCPTDLNNTAVLNGYISSWYDEKDEYDPFDIHFYPIWK